MCELSGVPSCHLGPQTSMYSPCGLRSHISRAQADERGTLQETMCLGIIDNKIQCQVRDVQLLKNCFVP